MPKALPFGPQVVAIVLGLVVGLAAVAVLVILTQTVLVTAIPFDTDEANHAVDGWEVYYAALNGGPAELYRAIVGQSFYPPVHSFLVAAGYGLAGPSLAASRLPTVVAFAVTLFLLAWLTVQVGRHQEAEKPATRALPLLGAALAVALALTSHVLVTQAVLVMQEMSGALLGLVLLWLAHRLDKRGQAAPAWAGSSILALLAMVLFLTKYSFGLFYLPAVVAALLTRSWPWRAERRDWLAAGVVVTIYLAVGGLWFAVTDRASMMLFFTDHPSYSAPFSAENLLYLVRLWLFGYSASWLIGLVAILLALLGVVRQWRQLAVRVAVWAVLVAFVVLTFSTTDEPRHLLPVVPAIWLLAGVGMVELLRPLAGRPAGGWVVSGVAILLVGGVLGSGWRRAGALRSDLVAQFEGTPALYQVHEFALNQVDLAQPVLFIGDFNDQNTLLALRWQAALRAHQSVWTLVIDYFPFENHEHSLIRTHRKPQIATVDPTFPRQYMNEVLDRRYFATLVEIKAPGNYFGPRAADPDDPLCGYKTVEEHFEEWTVIIYDISQTPSPCASE